MKSLLIPVFFLSQLTFSQNIGDFTSITPTTQSQQFVITSSHTFQKIIEVGDGLSAGGTLPNNSDFSGYVPISSSSTNGYLSINAETFPGGNSILDINFNNGTKLWETTASEAVNFSTSSLVYTIANCSGTITPWGTVISSEEFSSSSDTNSDGYYDFGWNIEIDPVTKTVVNDEKLWALGNFKHENVVIHSNERTVYQGADSNPGYLYKFVATNAKELNDGLLYAYKGSKNGDGNWILVANTTKTERNETFLRSGADPDLTDGDTNYADATVFNGIEDVEIGSDGWIYFAVKGAPDRRVYRFQDSDPISGTTVTNMETYVGNMNYNINDGSITTSVAWGGGNDNLAFDGDGNLWVMQDGDNNYIWVVKNGHTQISPEVEIFGIVPEGAEPTGITFTPDYKYLFMSVQHPNSGNEANQTDAAGNNINFDKGTTLVIARNENLGTSLSVKKITSISYKLFPNPLKSSDGFTVKGNEINNIKLYSMLGKQLLNKDYNYENEVDLELKNFKSGLYILKVNNNFNQKIIIE